jgi:MFS family permease
METKGTGFDSMDHEFALPSSSRLNLHAGQAIAVDELVAPKDIALAALFGRMAQSFGIVVFVIASALAFPQLLFPMAGRAEGSAFALCAVALSLAGRPVGRLMFNLVERRYGRRVKLTFAFALLALATAAVGFLPSYARAGTPAIALLFLFGLGQGLASGGAWDGPAAELLRQAPLSASRRAIVSLLGMTLALLPAGGLFAYFVGCLPHADFLEWGWRFPFLAAGAVAIVSLFARLRLSPTETFGSGFDHDLLARALTR